MKTRLIAAIVGLSILLPAVILGGPVAVEIIVPLVLGLVIFEYTAMAFPTDLVAQRGFMAISVGVPHAVALYVGLDSWGTALLGVAILAMIWVTLRPPEVLGQAADRYGRLMGGTTWLSLLTFLALLRRLDEGLAWVFVVLAISWLSDTGGYFAGRSFGKRKLYERISPKKTWEGVVGGMAAATLGMFVIRAVALPELGPVDAVILGTVVSGAGVIGDLSESMLKRAFDVKDAGNLLPGHGGFLDRIDSVLFVGPLVYGYAVWVLGVGIAT